MVIGIVDLEICKLEYGVEVYASGRMAEYYGLGFGRIDCNFTKAAAFERISCNNA